MPTILRNIAAGVVPSLFSLAYAITYGALIFSGPLQPYLATGVAAAMMTGAVTCIVLTLTSGFKPIIAGPDGATSALLAAIIGVLVPSLETLPPAMAVDFAIIALALASLVAAISQYALGYFRLGKLVRYIPYPVIAGFLGSTAWLLVNGAARMATGNAIGLALISRLAERGPLLELGLTIAWAAILLGLGKRFRHPVAVPVALAAATLATYLVLKSMGVSLAQARADGFLFSKSGGAHLVVPWLHHVDWDLPWQSLLPAIGDIAAVAIISIIAILLNATGIEVASRTESDLDHELRRHGLANLVSLLLGGFVGNVSISRTASSRQSGGMGRLPGLVTGLIMLAVVLSGRDVAAYVPRFLLSGLLLQLGVHGLLEWGVGSFKRLPLRDWVTVVAIIALTATVGTLWSVLYGIIACCFILALDVGRINIVRHSYGLDERPSSRLRPAEEMRALSEVGHRVQILSLGGFIFFGSAHRLYERVKTLTTEKSPRALIVDFSAVDGIDSSAGASFTKISSFLRDRGVDLIATGLKSEVLPFLRDALAQSEDTSGLTQLTPGLVLDEVMELWEDLMLAECNLALQPGMRLTDWLTVVLGGAEHALSLAGYMTPCQLAANDYICRQGDPTDALLFMERGRVSVLLEEPGRRPMRVRVFGPKTILGEVGFFLDTPRTATLRADEPTVVWSLSRDNFYTLRQETPETMAALFTYIVSMQSERLAFATRQIASLNR
jgi:SulP family sulfate permease